MKGYAFMNMDNQISYRTKEYIDTQHPGFWKDNEDTIIKAWPFDTENEGMMRMMFRGMQNLRIRQDRLNMFAAQIDYDLANFTVSAQAEEQPAFVEDPVKGNPF